MPILTETFEGSPEGMNVWVPSQELPDTQARYMQDILVDYPGLIRRRGPVESVPGMVAFSNKIVGLVQTLDPAGSNRVGALNGNVFSALSDFYNAKTDIPWPWTMTAAPPSNPYPIVDAKQALGGGAFIGVSTHYGIPTNQALARWRGSRKLNYTTGSITCALNSKTVTGSGTAWAGNVEPGGFLFLAGTFVGVVKTVDSNTQLTLEKNAIYAAAGAGYTIQSLRGVSARVAKGRITTDTASTAVTGATTKFRDWGLDTTWRLFRLSDMTWIGDVASVQTNTGLTLTANAAVALSNERYVGIRISADPATITTLSGTNRMGFLTAVYAERQWYANLGTSFDKTSRLYYSDPKDFEAVDFSESDGDFIPVGQGRDTGQPIRQLAPAYNALLILKDNVSYALRGSGPSSFAVSKLMDDGILSAMSMQNYAGGVIWAGKDGVYFYDGVQTDNLVQQRLGDFYKNMVRSFDPSRYRMWSMMAREHYFLFIEQATPNIPVVKGLKSTTPTALCIVINMPTRAVVTMQNVNIRGSAILPSDSGEATWYAVNDATKGFICPSNALFDEGGSDAINSEGTIAPTLLLANSNHLNDADRAASTLVVGQRYDGLKNDSSWGLWTASTNLFTNGAVATNLTNWNGAGSWFANPTPITRETGQTDVPFGNTRAKMVTPGSLTFEGVGLMNIPVVSGVRYRVSAWIKGNGGQQLVLNVGGSGLTTGSTVINLASGWNRYDVLWTASATATAQFGITTWTPAVATTFYVTGVQVDNTTGGSGSTPLNPYVHTDGASQSPGNTGIYTDSSVLDGTQGWFAARVRTSAKAFQDFGLIPFMWRDTPGTSAMYVFWPGTVVAPAITLNTPAGTNSVSTASNAIEGMNTIIGAWTKDKLRISINGGPFAEIARTYFPAFWGTFSIGSYDNAADFMQGEMKWFMAGKGVVSNADRDKLYALGDTDPAFSSVSRDTLPSLLWTADTTVAAVPPAGPDFYYESKKFSAGDSLRKKLFKQLAIHYTAAGGGLHLDTVIGLNDTGQTSSSVFLTSTPTWDSIRTTVNTWNDLANLYPTWDAMIKAVFRPRRIKFLKRSTHLAFRIYQDNAVMSDVRLGPFQIGYKLQRPGRI